LNDFTRMVIMRGKWQTVTYSLRNQ